MEFFDIIISDGQSSSAYGKAWNKILLQHGDEEMDLLKKNKLLNY
jgi:hypothetical protein